MATVHFVGSVALDSPEDVFAAIGEQCGPYLKRVPDGEPGGRRLWISWQIPVLRANPIAGARRPGAGAAEARRRRRSERPALRRAGLRARSAARLRGFPGRPRSGRSPTAFASRYACQRRGRSSCRSASSRTPCRSTRPTSKPCCARWSGSRAPSRTTTWPSSGTCASRWLPGTASARARRPFPAWRTS